MNEIAGYKLTEWYFKDYKYVSDLIDFEGPVLVHYMKNEHHAFYLHVDGDEKYNRWLCFELTIIELFDYMHKTISLYELIEQKAFQAFFTVDIDANLGYSNYKLIQGYAIPEAYLPDKISYYLEPISSIYEDLFSQYDEKLYKAFLRERAIELSIHSTEGFGGTNSLTECREFLDAIDSSNKNFNAYHSFNYFKKEISDMSKLRKIVSNFVSASQFRVANVRQNSFHISLAIDLVMKNETDESIKINELRSEISDKYREEVLNKNLNDEKDIDEIKAKYDETARKKIFEPLINIINNPKLNLTFIDKKTNTIKTFEKVSQYSKNLILPKSIKKEEPEEETEENMFYTVTLAVSKNKNIASISKKDLQEATLFSQYSTETFREFQKFTTDKYFIYFKEPVKLKYAIQDGGVYVISFEPLGISSKNTVLNNSFSGFLDELERVLEEDFMAKTPKNIKNKKYFDNNISNIEYVEGKD